MKMARQASGSSIRINRRSLHDVQVTERHGNSFVAGGVDIGSYVAIAGVNELKEGQKVRLNEKGAGL